MAGRGMRASLSKKGGGRYEKRGKKPQGVKVREGKCYLLQDAAVKFLPKRKGKE